MLIAQRLVGLYFDAWTRHDDSAIFDIFSHNAVYILHPRGRILMGVEHIAEYWRRNAKRQRDLTVRWNICASTRSDTCAQFAATFYDLEEGLGESIRGTLRVEVGGRKIEKLEEWYVKDPKLDQAKTPHR